MYVCRYVCIYVCMYVYMHVGMYLLMYVCMYVYKYVLIYASTYVCIIGYTSPINPSIPTCQLDLSRGCNCNFEKMLTFIIAARKKYVSSEHA